MPVNSTVLGWFRTEDLDLLIQSHAMLSCEDLCLARMRRKDVRVLTGFVALFFR